MHDLPITYRGVVYPCQCDHVGHMNVMWYVGKFDEATWQLFAMFGLTPSFLREQARGMAAVQQNISYKRELRPGDVVSIHSGVLEIREKAVRFFHEMCNDETGEIAATAEMTGVHLDTVLRKSCPFPGTVFERAGALILPEEGGNHRNEVAIRCSLGVKGGTMGDRIRPLILPPSRPLA